MKDKEKDTLESLLAIHGTLMEAQHKIESDTGIEFPYETLNHWRKGRFDLTTIERAFAIKEFYHLSDERFLEILRNSKKK